MLGWREVPTDNACLGDIARASEPAIGQLFIGGEGLSDEELERRLFVTRKRVEHRVREQFGEAAEAFYIVSMSCRTIVYKGMFLAPQLGAYYPDLSDPRTLTALAIVHQRYSTNTFPSWKLAQPFRMIAHNGEINTLRGNTHRLQGHEKTMHCPALDKDLSGLFPILEPGGSDSACFDNAMELLVRAGRSAPHAMMMMIPEAFGPLYHISTDKRAFYEYHAAIMEPWDGPAAMVFTDGRLVGGTLDRNGLRPCRYVVTTDGLVVMASEVGVIEFPPEKIAPKGPPSARPHVPRRHAGRSDRHRQRDQGEDRPAEALPPLARGEPDRVAGAVSAVSRGPDRPRHARRPVAVLRLQPRRVADDPLRRWRPTRRSRWVRWARTRRWRFSRTGRSCCSTISSSFSPRSPTRRSTRCAKGW